MKDLYESKTIKVTRKNKENNICRQVRSYHAYNGLMCPACYDYEIVKFNYTCNLSIEHKSLTKKDIYSTVNVMIDRKCPNCKGYFEQIIVDPNIIESISILNKKGFYTEFCCEGHDNEYPPSGYIKFRSRLILEYLDKLPSSWYHDIRDNNKYIYLYNCVVIRSKGENKQQELQDLLEFAKSLPDIKNKGEKKDVEI